MSVHSFNYVVVMENAETGIVEQEIITHQRTLDLFRDLYLHVMISTTSLITT